MLMNMPTKFPHKTGKTGKKKRVLSRQFQNLEAVETRERETQRYRDRCVAGERGTVYPPALAGMRMLSSAMDSTRTTAPSSRNLAQMRDFEGDFAVGRPLSKGGEAPGSSSRSLLQDNHGIVGRVWQCANKSFTSFIALCVLFCLSALSCCQCSKFGA
jgi:hypothetical protein